MDDFYIVLQIRPRPFNNWWKSCDKIIANIRSGGIWPVNLTKPLSKLLSEGMTLQLYLHQLQKICYRRIVFYFSPARKQYAITESLTAEVVVFEETSNLLIRLEDYLLNIPVAKIPKFTLELLLQAITPTENKNKMKKFTVMIYFKTWTKHEIKKHIDDKIIKFGKKKLCKN